MEREGVLLYGPPASGKDTITRALTEQSGGRLRLFEKLKIGLGNHVGYRRGDRDSVDDLRRGGLVLYENEGYGNLYVIDRDALESAFNVSVPVLHLGQLRGVQAVKRFPARWLSVHLHCSRETCEQRLKLRRATDIRNRLRTWDKTAEELADTGPSAFDLRLPTETLLPDESARAILSSLMVASGDSPSPDPRC
jgi:guanylate kinase